MVTSLSGEGDLRVDQVQPGDVRTFGIVVGSHVYKTLLEASFSCGPCVVLPPWTGKRLAHKSGKNESLSPGKKGVAAIRCELSFHAAGGSCWIRVLSGEGDSGRLLLSSTQCHPSVRDQKWWRLADSVARVPAESQ